MIMAPTSKQGESLMKNIFRFGLFAAAALSIFACSKVDEAQIPEEGYTHTTTIKVKKSITKTVINEGGVNASFKWSSDDASRFYLKENEVVGTGIAIASSDEYSTITITATFTTVSAAEYTYSGFLSKNKTGTNKPRVPATQTCTSSSYDPDADILVAKSLTYATTQDNLEMQFARPVVVNKMTLKGLTAGETLSKVTISADKNFMGYYDPSSDTWTTDGAELVVNTNQVVPASGEVVIWFVTAPVDAATLTVVAETGGGTYSKTFGSTISFVQNQVTRFGVSSLTRTPNYSGIYVLTNAAGTKMANAWAGGNNIPAVDATLDGGTIYFDPDDITIANAQITVTKITDPGSTYYGMYTMVQNGKYLYAAHSTKNQLKGEDEADINAYWDISETDGNWSIAATQSSNNKVLQYNTGSILFSCYASDSQTAVALKSNFAPTPVITSEASIALTSAAVSSATSTGATFNSNTATVTAAAYSDVECTVAATWLSVSTSGSGSSTVVNYTATANDTGLNRTGYIKITASNGTRSVSKVITVTQATAGPTEHVATINFGSADGSTKIQGSSHSGSGTVTYTDTGDDSEGNTWTITTVTSNDKSFTQNASYSQVGASSKPVTSITFTTTLSKSATSISLRAKFGGFSGTAGDIALKVGDSTIGSGALSAASDVTVTSSSTGSGTVLTVTVTNINKGVKCYWLEATYTN